MTITNEPRRRGRPTESQAVELQHRLRSAALQLFVERGYDGTTMEAVARAADISKRTLYARHPDKDSLFTDVITWGRSQLAWQEPDLDIESVDLAEALTTIARATLARAIDPDVLAMNQVAASVAGRCPELFDLDHVLGQSPRLKVLSDVLRHHAEIGTIVLDDVELAAEQFIGLAVLLPGRLAAIGVIRPPEEEERRIHHAVDLFLHGALPR